MSEFKCSTKVGSLLIVQITDRGGNYVAEVIEEEPLRLKVTETGPFSNLKDGDFVIREDQSCFAQDESASQKLLSDAVEKGSPLLSGLASLGITDGKIHELFPVVVNNEKVGSTFENVLNYSIDKNSRAIDLLKMSSLEGRYGSNGGRGCDVRSGPCSCGAWH